MKRLFLLPLLLITIFLLPNCKKQQTNNDDPTDSTNVGTDDKFGSFTFTARGENVICDPTQNSAVFDHNFHGVNYLTIYGINDKEPKNHMYQISIDAILKGELQKGKFNFVTAKPFFDCYNNNEGCDMICNGGSLPNGDPNTDNQASNKALLSTGGTMNITKFNVGKYVNGSATGHISGTFTFNGTEFGEFGQNPGSASGKFDDIPLLVQQ